jgi:hypothetical protein
MPTILIVEKTGAIKELNVKTFDEEELYKKAGFKSAENFQKHATFSQESLTEETNSVLKNSRINVYGKTKGKANQENKYDFPPPIDSTLFFGSCVIVAFDQTTENVKSLTKSEWEKIYEALFGGFEDLGDSDSDESSEEDEEEGPRTKEGYLKDDFVVDDVDEDEDDEDDDDYEEEEEEVKPKKKAAPKKNEKKVKKVEEKKVKKVEEKKVAKQPAKKRTVFDKIDTSASQNEIICEGEQETQAYLGCTEELEEEEYV